MIARIPQNFGILQPCLDAAGAVVTFFRDPMIGVLQDGAGEVWIVAGVARDRSGGAGSKKMRIDRDAERHPRRFGYRPRDGGVAHAKAGVGREPSGPAMPPSGSKGLRRLRARSRRNTRAAVTPTLAIAPREPKPDGELKDRRFDRGVEITRYATLVGAPALGVVAIEHDPPSLSNPAKARLQFQRSEIFHADRAERKERDHEAVADLPRAA